MQPDIQAQSIMRDFAAATGLSNTSIKPRRYLWTDSFAVCNYLQFYRQSGDQLFLRAALALVDQVHEFLGRQRGGEPDGAWLSGLNKEQARQHPTQGGLRIGKPLDERKLGEPVNESLEWQQDGQYFHYLTKWMHALYCVSRDTGDYIYHQWALELAKVAHSAFVYTPFPGRAKRMYWKMSVDLSHPLVSSMGHQDPLDGLITFQQLHMTAKRFPEIPAELTLEQEISEMSAICGHHSWESHDALGIGGLLTDAYKLVQLIAHNHLPATNTLEGLLQDILSSLRVFFANQPLTLPDEHRLAFRELGLAIGLQATHRMQNQIGKKPESFSHSSELENLLIDLSYFDNVHEIIQNFWSEPKHQLASSWLDHADINNVMLATSLAPDGYLQL